MTNDEARRNDEIRMTKDCGVMSMLFSCFVIRISFVLRHLVFSYGQRVYCHRGHEIAPSNKQASRFWEYRRSRRAILVSQSWRRCRPLQRQPSFHRATGARPDDTQPQWWLGQNRTRPTLLPFAFVPVLARGFPDKTFARVPCPKRQ